MAAGCMEAVSLKENYLLSQARPCDADPQKAKGDQEINRTTPMFTSSVKKCISRKQVDGNQWMNTY